MFSIPQGDKQLVAKVIRIGDDGYLDIRRYYIDSVTNLEKPTSRGIRLSVQDAKKLVNLGVLDKTFYENVLPFLKGGDAIA